MPICQNKFFFKEVKIHKSKPLFISRILQKEGKSAMYLRYRNLSFVSRFYTHLVSRVSKLQHNNPGNWPSAFKTGFDHIFKTFRPLPSICRRASKDIDKRWLWKRFYQIIVRRSIATLRTT